MNKARWASGLVLALWIGGMASGCGDDCTAGASVPCACSDGSNGAQRCNSDGTFGSCVCDEPVLPDAGSECTANSECDDGVFCNGEERCVSGECRSGRAVNCHDELACTIDSCNEDARACMYEARDEDGDGHRDGTCLDMQGDPLGDDCDDSDARRYPGTLEVCDDADLDEDCDPATYGAIDLDQDGYDEAQCCNAEVCGTDCHDTRASVNPNADEACDGFDNDCDGTVDEGLTEPGFVDDDRDGHGDPLRAVMACPDTVGIVASDGDCDDDDPTRHPDQVEVCDQRDNNCDPQELVDENPVDVAWYLDQDGDGFGDPSDSVISCVPLSGRVLLGSDCDDSAANNNPAAAERCDGVDNDCNGSADFRIAVEDHEDDDQDGAADNACGGEDCNDDDPVTQGQSGIEICDLRDNDCDGRVDEGALQAVFFRDADGDGYGTLSGGSLSACARPNGYSASGGDCDDMNASASPALSETCGDAIDNDCDGQVDPVSDCPCTCSLDNAATTCVSESVCVLDQCNAGFGNCDFLSSNGCEIALNTANNCGACGKVCGTNASCINTAGVIRCECNPGFVGDGARCASATDPNACGLSGKVCASGACVDGDCVRRVFITSSSYPANLGGRAAYDATCQTLANTRGLGGFWRAWLSDDSGSPSTLFVRGMAPYRRLDGMVVANDWADLTDGAITTPILINDQRGTAATSLVWTNTTSSGTRSTANACVNFTATSGNLAGNGQNNFTNIWTSSGAINCGTSLPVYCFEQ